MWPPCSKGNDTNTCDVSKDGNVVAVGDDFSNVKLFKYPAYKENAGYLKFLGHASTVEGVRFSADN